MKYEVMVPIAIRGAEEIEIFEWLQNNGSEFIYTGVRGDVFILDEEQVIIFRILFPNPMISYAKMEIEDGI